MTENQTVCIVPGLNMGDPILEIRIPKDSPDLIIENRVEEGRVVEARFTLPAEAEVIQKPGVSATKEEMMLKAAGFESARLGGPCCSFEEYTNPSKNPLMPVEATKDFHGLNPKVYGGFSQDALDYAATIQDSQDPNGLPQHAPGAKNDAGKNMAGLLLDFRDALLAVSAVGSMGAAKYSIAGWREVPDGIRRYRDAGMRHRLQDGMDNESGMPHLWHVAWNILAEIQLLIDNGSCPHPKSIKLPDYQSPKLQDSTTLPG